MYFVFLIGFSQFTKFVSSNCYHGHHLNISNSLVATKDDADDGMEVESQHPVITSNNTKITALSNGFTNSSFPSTTEPYINNGHINNIQPFSKQINSVHLPIHKNGSNGFFNGAIGFPNGHDRTDGFKDVTLCPDVSSNRIPIGGKKRSREEVFSEPDFKRIRTAAATEG